MLARSFANDMGDAGRDFKGGPRDSASNRDGGDGGGEGGEGSSADSGSAAAETDYAFDGFRIMSNEKIMLMPATPALAASGAARRGS